MEVERLGVLSARNLNLPRRPALTAPGSWTASTKVRRSFLPYYILLFFPLGLFTQQHGSRVRVQIVPFSERHQVRSAITKPQIRKTYKHAITDPLHEAH
jgi:hypothetical protein